MQERWWIWSQCSQMQTSVWERSSQNSNNYMKGTHCILLYRFKYLLCHTGPQSQGVFGLYVVGYDQLNPYLSRWNMTGQAKSSKHMANCYSSSAGITTVHPLLPNDIPRVSCQCSYPGCFGLIFTQWCKVETCLPSLFMSTVWIPCQQGADAAKTLDQDMFHFEQIYNVISY